MQETEEIESSKRPKESFLLNGTPFKRLCLRHPYMLYTKTWQCIK